MSSPDSLGVPNRDEAEELERKRAAWEAMSAEERQSYNAKIDQETAVRNARRDLDDERENATHREKYIDKKAVALTNISVQHGVDVIVVAKRGKILNIIDADCNRHISNDVKIRTADGKEEWIDSMCIRVQE